MKKIFSLLILSLLASPAWAATETHCRNGGYVGEKDFTARIAENNNSARVYFNGQEVARLSLGEVVTEPGEYGATHRYYPANEYALKVTSGGIADMTTAVIYETDLDSLWLAMLDTCEEVEVRNWK